eukprot:2958347-Pyramimonas_sp.AAC.1
MAPPLISESASEGRLGAAHPRHRIDTVKQNASNAEGPGAARLSAAKLAVYFCSSSVLMNARCFRAA